MKRPLFAAGLGDFVSVQVNAFVPRWALRDIWEGTDAARRQQLRESVLEVVAGKPAEKAVVTETPFTIRYAQALSHPRLEWATRRLELWKHEPRARLTFRFNRRSSHARRSSASCRPCPATACCRG